MEEAVEVEEASEGQEEEVTRVKDGEALTVRKVKERLVRGM